MSIHKCGRWAAMVSSAFARIFPAILLPALSSITGLLLALSCAWAAPSIGPVQLTPTSIAAGIPTTVRITAAIDDPDLIPSTVNLQRLNDAGAPVAVLGALRDDGLSGDAVGGDHLYTLDVQFTESAPVRLRVSAGFKRLVKRLFSAEMLLNINRPPVADAGRDFDVVAGTDVEVDGRLSNDPDGDRLTYLWTLEQRPAGSSSELYGVDRVRPVFFADHAGDYQLRLVVNDGKIDSEPVFVRVHASASNAAPTASAGADQNVAAGVTVRLDGRRSSDPEGSALTYFWELADQPGSSSAALDDPNSATPAFVADLAGRYVLRLLVSDGIASSAPDEILISAHGGNTPPTAVPGPDQRVAPGSRVALDGSASFDPDPGDGIARYAWTFAAVPQGSSTALSPPTQVFPNPPLTSFVADVAGDYLIDLVVTDHRGARSAPRRMLIQAGSPAALKPALTRLVPDQVVAGTAALALSVEGLRFDPAAKVVFGTMLLNTRFLSATLLSADVPAILVAIPGSFPVLVRNPAAAGGDSNSRLFTVGPATPILSAVTPHGAGSRQGRNADHRRSQLHARVESELRRHSAGNDLRQFDRPDREGSGVAADCARERRGDRRRPRDGEARMRSRSPSATGWRSTASHRPKVHRGTLLTIDGSGFVPTASGNQVKIGGRHCRRSECSRNPADGHRSSGRPERDRSRSRPGAER
jgi:hypothetical protein